MKLTMLTSLGTSDARRLGLPAHAEGDVIDCDRAAADALLKCGWAAAHAPDPPKPLPPAAAGLSSPPKPGNGK